LINKLNGTNKKKCNVDGSTG